MTVWTVKGGRNGQYEGRFLDRGIIGGGWDALGDLAAITSREQLGTEYGAAYPDTGKHAASNYVGQLWSLSQRMQKGDLVVLPVKTTGTIAVGRIAGPYAYRHDLGDDLVHVRPVTWEAKDVPRDAFDQDLLYSFGAYITFGQVRRENAEARILAALKRRGSLVPLPGPDEEQVPEADLEEHLSVDATAREQIRQFVSRRFAGHAMADLVAAVLEAQGFTVLISSPGRDEGVDVLAGAGPLGLQSPRIAVQVKTGQAGVEELRALRGVLDSFQAEQGLLVAWAGFRGTLQQEARRSHFVIRLWDADALLDQVFGAYDRLSDEMRAELPLKRVWALVPPPD